MASKRFVDINRWNKPWFRKLGSEGRDIWNFINDNCESAGIWEIDLEGMSFNLGFEVTMERIKSIFGDRIKFIGDNKLFIPGVIKFQCGDLSEACKPHLPIIKRLKELGLYKDYTKGLHTLEEKEEEKDKDKEILLKSKNSKIKFSPQDLVQLWNSRMQTVKSWDGKSIALVDKLLPSQERYRLAKSRIAEMPDPEYWAKVFDLMATDNFCRGKDNKTGWVMNFIYAVRPETHATMTEKYKQQPRIVATIAPVEFLDPNEGMSDEERKIKAQAIKDMIKNSGLKLYKAGS